MSKKKRTKEEMGKVRSKAFKDWQKRRAK